jgi:hypothetical protein
LENKNICFTFVVQNEAIHNKDYSVVKTFKAGPCGSPFFFLKLAEQLLFTQTTQYFYHFYKLPCLCGQYVRAYG